MLATHGTVRGLALGSLVNPTALFGLAPPCTTRLRAKFNSSSARSSAEN